MKRHLIAWAVVILALAAVMLMIRAAQAEELVTEALAKKPDAAPPKKPERKIAVKDVRIFVNTINKAVDVMRLSGINAISRRCETDDYIEYTVKIPKAVGL